MRTLTSLLFLLLFIGITQHNRQTFTGHQLPPSAPDKNLIIEQKQAKRYDKPSEAAAWLHSMRQAPKGTTPAALNLAYQQQFDQQKQNSSNQNLTALKFTEIGPGIFGGRIRGFVIHPNREGHLLAGGVSGGIWKTTNDGQSWEPKTDFLSSIAIGSMLLDPDDPETVYAGTGEGFFNFDAAQGFGIFVSEDFGESWQPLANTDNENFYFVNRMLRIPGSNALLVATRTGIFKTTNNGNSWSEVSGVATSSRGFTDLQMDPSNPNHLLAYHFGFPNIEVVNVNVSSPASLAGDYDSIPAGFGPQVPGAGISGELLLVDDGSSPVIDGCEAINTDLTGKIALIERGSCNFTVKVVNAQDAGATAVVIFQNTADGPFVMGGEDDSITIPSVMISKADGDLLSAGTPPINVTISGSNDLVQSRFLMRSTNGGDLWSVVSVDGFDSPDLLRAEIGFGTDGTVYVSAARDAEDNPDGTLGLWRSPPGNSLQLTKTASNTGFIERQGWYDLAIAVNPDDSDHVFMGAVDMFSTTNGGTTISQNSFWSPGLGQVDQYVHADHHGYFFSPFNSNHLYIVSDGGVAKSEDGGQSFFSLNNGLNISQSYGIGVSPDGQRVTSGTQDNGSQLYFGNTQDWLEWQGGDGGYSGWDQQQDNFVYGSYVRGQMYGSANGGFNAQAMDLPDTEGARFIQPFVLDENNGNRMLVGTDNVFFTNNARFLGNATWQDVTGTINGAEVSAVAFNPHITSEAYAGMVNSATSGANQIVKIISLGSANTVTDIGPDSSLGVANDVVTDIRADLFDTSGQTLYATFGNYEPNRVLRSTNGGNSWSSISGNLPDMPVFRVINDPDDASVLYLGTELGLWVGQQSGNSYVWHQFDYGPANTRVIDLVWRNGELFIGTHGRGTYVASKQAVELELLNFIPTNSTCGDDNILDRGEAGKLLIRVSNRSAKNLSNIELNFAAPQFVNFTDASQSLSLDGFSSQTIALPISLSSNASCLAELTIPVDISTSVGQYSDSISITTAAVKTNDKGDFSDGAESAGSLMSSMLSLGNDGWIRVSDRVNSGNQSWFTTNENSFSDKSLMTPWMTFDGGGNVLSFALAYDTEGDISQRWDGMVLEMRLAGSDLWFDIGHLSSVPYDGQLFTNNTIQGRFAWSGTQLNWREATVDLGTQFVGQRGQIRFRMVSDINTSQEGVWLDDITVSNVITDSELSCDACISGDNTIPNKGHWYDPARDGHGFIVEAFGAQNLYYTMFYTYDDQGNPEWLNSLTTLENGVLNQGFAANTLNKFLYQYGVDPLVEDPFIPDPAVTDGRLSINFNTDEVRDHPACLDGTNRNLDFVALATWRINNVTEEWCIEPLIADEARPSPDFGTGWWGGQTENGWGYSLAQVADRMIVHVFYYDADGNARWATGSESGFAPGTDITIPMFDVQGYGRTAPLQPFSLISSGTVVLNLSNTFRDLDTDGTTTIDVTYQGVEGGRWLREDIPIMTLLQEH
jgi:hypothetical protein